MEKIKLIEKESIDGIWYVVMFGKTCIKASRTLPEAQEYFDNAVKIRDEGRISETILQEA